MIFFNRTRSLCALLLGTALILPRAEANDTPDGPVGVAVLFKASGFDWGYTGWLTLDIDALNGTVGDSVSAYDSETEQFTARLEPGKTYALNIDSEDVGDFILQAVPPPGYVMEIERVARERMVVTLSDPASLRIRVMAPYQEYNGRAGTATSVNSGRVLWQVALGSLLNGSSAGALAIIDTGTSQSQLASLFTPAALQYEQTSSEVSVVRNPASVSAPFVPLAIRQIVTPEAIVDIISDTTEIARINFYHPGQGLTYDGGQGLWTAFKGRPFATYHMNQDGAYPNRLRISMDAFSPFDEDAYNSNQNAENTKNPLYSMNTVLERSGTAPNFAWTADRWYGTSSLARDTRSRSGSTETISVAVPSGATALSGSRTYTSVPWGEEVSSESVGTSDAVTTSYSYYTSVDQAGNYGRMQSRLTTGGRWEAYEYYDYATSDEVAGALHRLHRPYVNSDTAVPGDLATHTGEVTTFSYQDDAFGRKTRPASVETKIGGLTTASSSTSYSTPSAPFSARPTLYLVTATRTDWAGGDILTTTTKYFQEDAGVTYYREGVGLIQNAPSDDFFRFQTHSIQHPDGRRQSFVYQRGSWSGSSFSTSGNGGIDDGPASRIAILHGASSGGTSYTTHWGYDIDDLHLVANKSTMDVTIRNDYALIVRTESHVWTGSAWEPVNSVSYTYNNSNQLTSRVGYNGGLYQAAYFGERLDWEKNDNGAKHTYLYDDADRVLEVTREGGLTTRYSYNAANQLTGEIVGWGVSGSLTTSRTYDSAGRLETETLPGLGTTTHSYNPASRTRTVTMPTGGGSRTDTFYNDGQLKSITGSAVVERHLDYAVESSGFRRTDMRIGSSSSSRIIKSWRDWLGRLTKTSRPGWYGNPDFEETWGYESGTGRLGLYWPAGHTAPTRYTYNVLGQLVRTGLDRSADGLSLNSDDRVTDFDQSYLKIGDHWWLRDETKIYPKSSDPAWVTASVSRRRLSGHGAGRMDEVHSTDIEGNTVERRVDVDRDNDVTVITTIRSGLATNQVETIDTGLHLSTVTHEGLTYQTEYDALRRPWKAYNPRSKLVTTTYKTGSMFVETVRDHLNQGPTYSYDNNGRRIMVVDAAGKKTRYEYDTQGRIKKQWGNGAHPVSYDYNAQGDLEYLHTYRGAPVADSESWPSVGTADTRRFEYNEATGLLYREHYPNPSVPGSTRYIEYGYNERRQVGLRDAMRPHGGGRIRSTYGYDDDTGELTSITYNDGTPAVSYSYNRLGQLKTFADANTGTSTLTYDPAKPWRHYTTTLPGFYGNRVQTSLYEGIGVVGRYQGFKLGASAGSASDLQQAYTYTANGRFDTLATHRATTHDKTFRYGYRSNSNLVESLSIDGGHNYSVTRGYHNDLDLLDSIDTKWSTTSRSRHDYTYNSLYQRATARQSGSFFEDYGAQTYYRYGYNDRGELQEARAYLGSTVSSTASPLPGRQYEFAYDSIGNREWTNRSGNSADREYYTGTNSLNQYGTKDNHTLAVQGTVADGASVAVGGGATAALRQGRYWAAELSLASGDPWQGTVDVYAAKPGSGSGGADLLREQSVTGHRPPAEQDFVHDEDGNLTGDGVWLYTYDAENRLTSIRHDPGALGTGKIPVASARKLEFRYDALGRRISKIVWKDWNTGSQTFATKDSERRYLYDGWNMVAEFSWSGSTLSLVRSYTWGLDLSGSLTASGGVGALLQIHDHGASKTLLTAYDGNGNVTGLLNADTGAVEAVYEYSPFGEQIRVEGPYAKENPFRFSTKFHDQETGLVYYGHRFYAPGLGRFINRDPIGEAGGLNLYGFAGNDGINGWDYLGMEERSIVRDFLNGVTNFFGSLFRPGSGGYDGGNTFFPIDLGGPDDYWGEDEYVYTPMFPSRSRGLFGTSTPGYRPYTSFALGRGHSPTDARHFGMAVHNYAPNSADGLPHEAIEIFTRLDKNGDGFINILDEVQEGRGIIGMPDDQRLRVSENHKDLIRLIEEFGFTNSNIGFLLDQLSSPNYIPDDSTVSHASAGSVIIVTATGAYVLQQGMKLVRGGRLGSADVRDLNAAIARKLERAGWTIVRGGGRDKEAYLKGAGPGTKGGNYSDIMATRNGQVLHVNTVSTRADGVTPTKGESRAATMIRIKLGPNERLILIPKGTKQIR